MKLNILFSAFLFALCSCAKERTCTCVTSLAGTKTVVSKTAPVVISYPPLVPTTTVMPGSEQTSATPYNSVSTEVIQYGNIRKGTLKQICGSMSTTEINTSDQVVSASSTVTTTDSGVKTITCRID